MTGYLHLFYSRGQESLLYRNAGEDDTLEEFIYEVQRITERDPRQAGFIENGGYQAFLRYQGEELQRAIDNHEGIFMRIEEMTV